MMSKLFTVGLIIIVKFIYGTKKHGQSHVMTTAAANIPVKRAVRRPWLTTETMDIIDQKKEARLKGNHDEWKRL